MYKTHFYQGLVVGILVTLAVYSYVSQNRPQPITKPSKKIIHRVERVPIMNIRTPITLDTRRQTNFKQIGLLFSSASKTTLPLYGKPTYVGSHTWNYYTYVNDYHQLMIPIEIYGRDCMTDIGCKEIYGGDEVFIPNYDETFVVKLYENSMRYVPF
jgi:hypothetical protein